MPWMFDAPGGLKDFTDPEKWHERMKKEASGIVKDLVSQVLKTDAPTDEEVAEVALQLAYVDPTREEPSDVGETGPIAAWSGFPRAVRRRGPWDDHPPVIGDPEGVHRAAEHLGDEDCRRGVFVDGDDNVLHLPVRDRQDEYLEWSSARDANERLHKVTFVAEGYDYFCELFNHDSQRVVEIYREFTGLSNITADDLRAPKGVYRRAQDGSRETFVNPGEFNPRNRFNVNPGIVHLSHRANSLGAEVNLAGVSGIARQKADSSILSGENAEELLCCCAGGNPNRNSDPSISQQAYLQVKSGYRYTLANPVGLYIAAVERSRILTIGGHELPHEWMTVVRGDGIADQAASRVLRLEFAPPKGESLTLEDLEVDGEPLRFAGQIADAVLVHLFITRWKRPADGIGPLLPCIATCCRKNGTETLGLSDGECGPGYDLAFPGLVDANASPPKTVSSLR